MDRNVRHEFHTRPALIFSQTTFFFDYLVKSLKTSLVWSENATEVMESSVFIARYGKHDPSKWSHNGGAAGAIGHCKLRTVQVALLSLMPNINI